jgi:Cytochrome C biogenesis protein
MNFKIKNWKMEKSENQKNFGIFNFLIFPLLCIFVMNSFVLAQDPNPSTLDPKGSSIAVEMRDVIQQQLEEGKSEREILAFFQERYGDWILLNPPKRGIHLLVWLLPLIVALVGAGLLVMYFRRWTKQAQKPVEASNEDLERVREEMKWQG